MLDDNYEFNELIYQIISLFSNWKFRLICKSFGTTRKWVLIIEFDPIQWWKDYMKNHCNYQVNEWTIFFWNANALLGVCILSIVYLCLDESVYDKFVKRDSKVVNLWPFGCPFMWLLQSFLFRMHKWQTEDRLKPGIERSSFYSPPLRCRMYWSRFHVILSSHSVQLIT